MKSKSDLKLDAYFASLSPDEVEEIRRRVQQGIASIEAGNYIECDGPEGVNQFFAEVKARGRVHLSKDKQ